MVNYRSSSPVSLTPTIAYIACCDAERSRWRDAESKCWLIGAQRQAANWGYRISRFLLSEPGRTGRQLGELLLDLRIKGVLLTSNCGCCDASVQLPWHDLFVVQIGHGIIPTPLHRVTDDAEGNVRLAVQRALAAGYERPGLVLARRRDAAAESSWSGGFTREQIKMRDPNRVPIAFYDDSDNDRADFLSPIETEMLVAWYREYRPDVLIGDTPLYEVAINHLDAAVPSGLGFIGCGPDWLDLPIARVRFNTDQIGAVAVDILVRKLRTEMRDTTACRTVTHVAGAWCDGRSLPPRRRTLPTGAAPTPESRI